MNKLYLIVISVLLATYSCKHEPINPVSNATKSGVCNTDTAYFQNDVLPLFVSSCAKSGCHDATTKAKNLNLSSYNSIMATGEIIAGKPNDGDIIKEINDGRMPPSGNTPLTTTQKDLLNKWISQGAKNNSCTSACDTSNVKFSAQVKTIIDGNCKNCHSGSSPQGRIDLSTFDSVKAQVTANKLYGSINHSGGFSPMPKGVSKLSDCQIRAVKIWIDAGTPNN